MAQEVCPCSCWPPRTSGGTLSPWSMSMILLTAGYHACSRDPLSRSAGVAGAFVDTGGNTP
jgi:hypothetical protein